MTTTYRSRAAEQHAVDAHEADRDLMCRAEGCPHRWSVDAGAGKLCSWHAGSAPHLWPQITQQRLDVLAERAYREQYREPPAAPKSMTRAEKVATLQGLRDAVTPKKGRRDWAFRIMEKVRSGARVSPLVRKMAQAVAERVNGARKA